MIATQSFACSRCSIAKLVQNVRNWAFRTIERFEHLERFICVEFLYTQFALDIHRPLVALARDAEITEENIFSFAVERTANENHQPLRGKVFLIDNQLAIQQPDKIPEGLCFFCFLASQQKGKSKFTLRALRLERSGR
jgi:hypothetical protein